MKAIKILCEDIKMGFKDYGFKFFPRLFLFPFAVSIVIVLTIAHDRVQRW